MVRLLDRDDRAELESTREVRHALLHEADDTVLNCVDGVILADANAVADVHLGTALADDDLARLNGLAIRSLDAEALGLGVAAVSCRALS